MHNAAKYGVKLLTYDVEILVLKVYAEFSLSAKNVENLKEFCEFAEQEYSEILRHLSVRWLSLERAVDRFLKNCKALKMYFVSQGAVLKYFRLFNVIFNRSL